MTKKDYELIARAFKKELDAWRENEDGEEQSEYIAVKEMAESMSIHLQSENPRFNKGLFLKACGL